MKFIFLPLLLSFSLQSETNFEQKAQAQSVKLKKSLMKVLKGKIREKGILKAVEFCHERALQITADASEKNLKIGRTSSKFRNPQNEPPNWMMEYLKEAEKTKMQSPYKAKVVTHKGDKYYLEPLYTNGLCLQCHGNPSGKLQNKITKLYPEDKATDYEAGDFRGFVWVKEVKN